jgi:hypothetical protein
MLFQMQEVAETVTFITTATTVVQWLLLEWWKMLPNESYWKLLPAMWL